MSIFMRKVTYKIAYFTFSSVGAITLRPTLLTGGRTRIEPTEHDGIL